MSDDRDLRIEILASGTPEMPEIMEKGNIKFSSDCSSLFGDAIKRTYYAMEAKNRMLIFKKSENDKLEKDFNQSLEKIVAFSSLKKNNGKYKIEIEYYNKELIKSICDDIGTITLNDYKDLEDDKDLDNDKDLADVTELEDVKGDEMYLLYAHAIFPLAIKSGNDYFVEYIIDKCIRQYNEYYNNDLASNILSIITASFPRLHDVYPDYARKFISTLTIYRTSDLKVSSDKHLQSYNHLYYKSSSYREELKSKRHELMKEFPRHRISPYFVTIVVYLTMFCLNVKGNIVVLTMVGTLLLSVLSLSGTIHKLIPRDVRESMRPAMKGKIKFQRLRSKISQITKLYETIYGRSRFSSTEKRLSVRLFVPFPKLVTYTKKAEKGNKSNHLLAMPDSNDFVKNYYDHWKRSFDLYSEWNGEALINFKWDHFGEYYYYWYWHIFNFFELFSALIIYPECPKHLVICIINIIIGSFLLSFEFRKFLFRPYRYLINPMNHLNLGTYGFQIYNSFYFALNNKLPPAWILASSVLLLHAKTLTFLRSIELYERHLVIILSVARHVFSFLIILILVIMAYADAFWIFLRTTTPDSPDNIDTNLYKLYQNSIVALYHLVMGDYDSLTLWNIDNPVIVSLWVTFTFIVVIYLLNLFVGLLSMAIEEKDKREFMLMHRAEVIFEIELFWLPSQQKERKDWFPDYIWYNVPVNVLREKIKEIEGSKHLYEGYKPIIHNELLKLVKSSERNLNPIKSS